MFSRRIWNNVPATYPNSILVQNPIHNPRRRFSYQKDLAPSRSSSTSHPPGFYRPVQERSLGLNHSSSISYPPGFYRPAQEGSLGNESRFNLAYPILGRDNYIRGLEQQVKELQKQNRRTLETDTASNQVLKTILLSNVSRLSSKEDLVKCCEVFGSVEKIMIHNSNSSFDLCFAFIRFESQKIAEMAVRRLKGTRRYGKVWRTAWAFRELRGEENDVFALDCSVGKNGVVKGAENKEISSLMEKSWLMLQGTPVNLKDIRTMLNNLNLQFERIVTWGLYGVIISCEDEAQMLIWEGKKSELLEGCLKIEKLSNSDMCDERYCWVECYGIPVRAWSLETFNKIGEVWGSLIALDEETDSFWRADVARLFVQTRGQEEIKQKLTLLFEEKEYPVKVVEFTGVKGTKFGHKQLSKLASPSKKQENIGGSKNPLEVPLENGARMITSIDYIEEREALEDGEIPNVGKQGESSRHLEDVLSSPVAPRQVLNSSLRSQVGTQVDESPTSSMVTPVFASKSGLKGLSLNFESPTTTHPCTKGVSPGDERECETCLKMKKLGERERKLIQNKMDKRTLDSDCVDNLKTKQVERSCDIQKRTEASTSKKRSRGRPKGSKGRSSEKPKQDKKKKNKKVNEADIVEGLIDEDSDSKDEVVRKGLNMFQQMGVQLSESKRLEAECFLKKGVQTRKKSGKKKGKDKGKGKEQDQ